MLSGDEPGLAVGVPALSSRLYLRIGFRDTSVIGALLMVIARRRLCTVPGGQGHGGVERGSSPAQLTRGRSRPRLHHDAAGRDAVDGRLVGSGRDPRWGDVLRFLGQSIGGAVFGAVTNTVLISWLEDPPPELARAQPGLVDGVAWVLTGGHPTPAVADFLRDALQASARRGVLGVLAPALCAVGLLLWLVPRRFQTDGSKEQRGQRGRRLTTGGTGTPGGAAVEGTA